MGTSKEGALLKSLGLQGLPSVPGAMIQDVFDPIAIWDEPLFSHQVFKFILMKLGKVLPFEDTDLLAARELELGFVEDRNHLPLVLQLGERIDMMHSPAWALATVPVGFPKAP